MKRLIFGLCSCFVLSSLSWAQNFNLIYIQLDHDMDYALVNQKLDHLIDQIGQKKESCILFYANTMLVRESDGTSAIDLEELHGLINNNRKYDIQMVDIKNTLLQILGNVPVCEIGPQQQLVPNPRYQTFNFHCLVGNSFYENNVLEPILFSCGLQNASSVSVYYYKVSSQQPPVLFNEPFSLNTINIISR